MKFPPEFAERMKILGQNIDSIYSTIPKKCIRTRAIQKNSVPWYDKATFDLNIKGYHQDPASLVPAIVLNPQSGEIILDMCAAPGSKTTQIWEMVDGDFLLYSVDIDKRRLMRLRKNIDVCGCNNIRIICVDAKKLKFNFQFDKILLDAPCSGEGIVLKAHKTFKIWSEKRVERLSKLQKKLIEKAFSLLKPDGILVYSTCTFETDENESVISYLLNKHPDAKLEKIDIPHLVCDRGIDMPETIRIWPYQNQTNGFFVAKIKKS